MVNAMSSRSNDYEPMFMNLDGVRLPSKESATLINSVLTAGAVYGFSGKDYITHEVVGEDLSVRIMAAGGRWNFDVGWDSSFTMPIYGVCAQFGRMRGLTPLQLRDAWGIAMGMVALPPVSVPRAMSPAICVPATVPSNNSVCALLSPLLPRR